MNRKKLRMPIDIAMTVLSIILMGGTVLFPDYRVHQVLGMLLLALLLMVSGLMMAWFIPSEAVGGGLGFARTSHLVESHWYLLFMCFHIGMHLSMMANSIPARYLDFARIAVLVASCYGIYAFILRGLWRYMLLLQQFFFLDLERGYILFAVDYISILILFSAVSHYISRLLLARNR